MTVDILQHEFVPKHEILSKNESKELLDRLGIPPEKLPKILAEDPTAKRIKASRGDILKISRKSPTARETVYYRLVV